MIEMENVAGNQKGRNPDNHQVGAKFFITEEGFELAKHDVVIKVKIDPKDQDSKADQIGDEGRMVVSNPVIEDGEPTSTSSPHSNDKAIIKRHASTEVDHDEEEEEGQIEVIKDLSCVLQFGYNFTKYGTRHFCFHHFEVAVLVIVHNS